MYSIKPHSMLIPRLNESCHVFQQLNSQSDSAFNVDIHFCFWHVTHQLFHHRLVFRLFIQELIWLQSLCNLLTNYQYGCVRLFVCKCGHVLETITQYCGCGICSRSLQCIPLLYISHTLYVLLLRKTILNHRSSRCLYKGKHGVMHFQ